MPQVIPYLAAYAASAAGATGAYAWVATAVFVATSVAVADYQRSRANERARAAAAAAARDRTITVRSGVAPRKYALGTVRLSGPLMYAEYVGAEEEYLDEIIALTHGEVGEFVGLYLNDEFVAVADIVDTVPMAGRYSGAAVISERLIHVENVTAASTVTLPMLPSDSADVQAILVVGVGDGSSQEPVTISSVVGALVTFSEPLTGELSVSYSSKANPKVPLRVLGATGSDSQASTSWSGVSAPKWTADHRLRGVSYLRTLTRLESEVFATGLPEKSAVVRGPKGVWDPRTDTTLAYCSNPALLAAWFRTLPRRDGGMGVPTTWIDWDSVATAADVCDELISVKKLDGSGYENVRRYECNTVLSLDQSPEDNLRVIVDSMAGDFPFTAGKYRCFAGAFRAATVTITDDDVAGDEPVTIAPLVGADQVPPNIVNATIYSASNNWMETGAPAVVNGSYVTADGAEEPAELDLPACTDLRQANYLMGVTLERLRPGLAGGCTLLGKGANIALLDTVQFNLKGYEALAGKTFEIRRRTNHWNGRYGIEFREVRASTYALDADRFTPPAVVTPPDDSGLWNVTPIAIAGVVNAAMQQPGGGVTARALVTWGAHPQRTVNPGGWIDLRYRSPEAEWAYLPQVPGASTHAYISPLTVGSVIFIEARARNGLGAISAWTGTAPFTVTDLNDVPPDVSGLAAAIKPGQVVVSWAQIADWHLYETELRVGASWAAGALLWAGQGTDYKHARPANGTYTLWAAYRSRAGVYSATPASTSITVDDTIDPGAPDSLYVEYSVDGSTLWHSTFAAGDLFARWKVGTGGTWEGPFRIVGEGGSAGDYVDFIFKRSATQPATPTGDTPVGWFDAPPAANGHPLWASTGTKTAAGTLVGVWSTPVQIEGAAGADGAAVTAYTNDGPVFVATSTGTSWTPATIVLRRFLSDGLTGGVTSWSVVAGTFTGSLSMLSETDGRMAAMDPGDLGTDAVTFRCTYTVGSSAYTDDITITKSRDGFGAYLTNEHVNLPASSTGAISSYAGATGTFKVTKAGADVGTSALAFAIVGHSGFGTTYPTNTGISITSAGVYTVSSNIPDATTLASVTFRATYTDPLGGTKTFDLVFTVGKSLQGLQGGLGSRGSLTGYAYGQYGISNASWSDGHANRTIYNILNGTSLTTSLASTSHLTIGDTVTESNGSTWSETRFWGGSGWLVPGTVISGNLLVGGTISGQVNLNITGSAKFEGVNSSLSIEDPFNSPSNVSRTIAAIANSSGAAQIGVYGASTTAGSWGVYGFNSATTGDSAGVVGHGLVGVAGVALAAVANAFGVYAAGGTTASSHGLYALRGTDSASYAIIAEGTRISAGNAIDCRGFMKVSGQVQSTVSTGTAPFIVASTTEVANLNVAQLKGKTWAAPDPLGATTPSTGRFTTLRVDATPSAPGANAATFSGLLPTGSAASTNTWMPISLNGTQYWIPVWVD